jgi:DNA (cytosine-5)-methyltransferase 1
MERNRDLGRMPIGTQKKAFCEKRGNIEQFTKQVEGVKIPVIDIFAGPGGLGEGIMSVMNNSGESVFDIKLSIEKDIPAHKTLMWRSFYRQFVKNNKTVPSEYYEAYRESNLKKREQLIELILDKYPEGEIARKEARLVELGADDWPPEKVDDLIKEQLGKNQTDWVLIGGPPCQAYSLAGRSRIGGIRDEDHRVHLYKEYLRIISRHHPAVFVMENVKGLLSARVDGESVFDRMLNDLKEPASVFTQSNSPKYKVYSFSEKLGSINIFGEPEFKNKKDFIIKSEKYGVPQKRHRVILLGIREDIVAKPETLKKKGDEVSLKRVIGDLPKLRSGIGRSIISSNIVNGRKKRVYKKEVDSTANWEKLINKFRKEVLSWNGFNSKNQAKEIRAPKQETGSEFIKCNTPYKNNALRDWYMDENLNGICNHETRTHLIEDLKRYLFASLYTKNYNRFPRLKDYKTHSTALMPDHESASSGKFVDRFRVQMAEHAATTVTSHISKDGHYFIHYDPNQCRSLTVREAARIQTFPDNYLFRGTRTAQYHQVGNAVPPYLAKQIGEIVKDILL